MKTNPILLLILLIPLISFAQKDSAEIGKKKNHFGILIQYGWVKPRLHTDYDYSTNTSNAYGIGLSYEHDLSKKWLLVSSIEYTVFRETMFRILENKDKYFEGFRSNYYIRSHIDFSVNVGVKYLVKTNGGKKELMAIGSTIGWGLNKFILAKEYNNLVSLYVSPYDFGDRKYGNYFLTSFSLSRKFLLGKRLGLEPYFRYNFMVNRIKHPSIEIPESFYFPAAKANFSFNSILFGMAFSF